MDEHMGGWMDECMDGWMDTLQVDGVQRDVKLAPQTDRWIDR